VNPIIQKTRAALAKMFPNKAKAKPLTHAQNEGLARSWGRLDFQSVVRHVPKAPVFVHCHECRWPVSPRRTHMATGAGFYADGSNALPATEDQMQRICEGVRRHMEVA
jgi:hypothetical protein